MILFFFLLYSRLHYQDFHILFRFSLTNFLIFCNVCLLVLDLFLDDCFWTLSNLFICWSLCIVTSLCFLDSFASAHMDAVMLWWCKTSQCVRSYVMEEVDVSIPITKSQGCNYFAKATWLKLSQSFTCLNMCSIWSLALLSSEEYGFVVFQIPYYLSF